jgi:hypothetical protein
MKPRENESKEAFMKRCKEAGKSDEYGMKCWNKHMGKSDAATDPVPTAETGANLSTATIVPPSSAPKSVSVDETEVNALVEQVVKSATESLKAEIESLVAAKEAALEKSVSLEAELATAKSLAVAGGPKRTGTSLAQDNDLLVKAATYKAKANATTDPVLVKGYMELAKEYYAKAEETLNK